MRVSRRDLLRFSSVAAAGTALHGLVGCRADLRPAVEAAQSLRIREAKATPSVCPYCAVGCGTIVHTIGATRCMACKLCRNTANARNGTTPAIEMRR